MCVCVSDMLFYSLNLSMKTRPALKFSFPFLHDCFFISQEDGSENELITILAIKDRRDILTHCPHFSDRHRHLVNSCNPPYIYIYIYSCNFDFEYATRVTLVCKRIIYHAMNAWILSVCLSVSVSLSLIYTHTITHKNIETNWFIYKESE